VDWVKREGLDLIRNSKVEDVFTQPLKPWKRTGGYGVHIQLKGTGDLNGAYICEIPGGESLKPQRHLYEELIYILAGRGSTSVWYGNSNKSSFEWQTGSLFAIPLNASHQHFNGAGSEPARYLAVTTAPVMLNLIRNEEFIFCNNSVFPERYDGEPNYFDARVKSEIFGEWDIPLPISFSNFFPDVDTVKLNDSNRGVRTRGAHFELANGVLGAHIQEFPGGTFTKIHRHGPGAHVLWLDGEGYTLMWPDGGEMVREDWRRGTVIVPPDWWWHQHCVVSREPARHLALKLSSKRNKVTSSTMNTLKSTRKGGNQMDYEDIPAEIRYKVMRIFNEECAKRGTPVCMEAIDD
jgi:quercetin dioxygenase-like cupin family protein